LNEIVEECIPPEDSTLKDLIVPENGRYQPT
jgi:hypothetical protein